MTIVIATDHEKSPGGDVSSSASMPWINLLGVRVSAVDMTSAVRFVVDAIAAGERSYICVRDVHGIVRCQSDLALREAHNRAFLVTPDGMPLVWSLKLSGHRSARRVYGPDLMLALFDRGRQHGLRHFLFGTTPEVLAQLESRLAAAFPGVSFVGSHAPPFRELSTGEEEQIVGELNRARPDIVWVGLGTPKQELWMARMRDRLEAPMLIGVDAAFDFHAGVRRQAPRFIQRSGFEWLFRLACEPRRLWRRYAVAVPSFLGLAMLQALGLRDFRIDTPPRTDAPAGGA